MIRILILLFVLIVGTGTLGYMLIENWNFLDALYMTVITLTTTGFGEVHPMSSGGRIFTLLILIGGVGLITYIITTLISIFVDGEHRKTFWRKKMEKRISEMKKHTIICGFGRMGQSVCEEFERRRKPFIVIEIDGSTEGLLKEVGYTYIIGDASSEDILAMASIKTANSLISIVSTDAENVYTVLSARELNRKIYIVSRALDQKARKKVLHAGANKVICPYAITGNRIAKTILDPAADDFIDFTLSKDFDVEIADIFVHSGSPLVGKTILESEVRKKGIIIMGIKQNDGKILFAPKHDRKIEENDRIIALGPVESIRDFNASV